MTDCNTPPPTPVPAGRAYEAQTESDGCMNFERRLPAACLFIASLPKNQTDSILHSALQEHFNRFGSSKIDIHRDFKFRPYSFAQFDSTEDCISAFEDYQMYGISIFKRQVRVEKAKVNRTILIQSNYFSNKEILDFVAPSGAIEESTLLPGCAFVKFVYRGDALRAYYNSIMLPDLSVEWVPNLERTSGKVIDDTTVFAGNLAKDITEIMLHELFGQYGELSSVSLVDMRNSQNSFGFVSFKRPVCAAESVKHLNGTLWQGNAIEVRLREVIDVSGLPQLYSKISELSDQDFPPL